LDLFPVYKKYIDENFERGWEGGDSEHWANKCFVCKHRVKFDLFNRYGLIAAAGDRHLAEFMPGDEYLKNPETVENWDFALTSVKWRKEDLQERLARSKRLAAFEEEVELKPTGEEGILLIKALCGLERVISNVNIPNTAGQIPNLPRRAVVETNAVFERDSIRPISAGPLPDNIYKLIIPHVENHERVLEAAFTYNKDLVIEAFMNDPLTKNKGSREEISKLVCDMIDATKKYLPKEWAL
ncbi:MAG: alpha-glucosidase/alpha-galactosidase, partial [Lachnospiraceae bacterium]|nr:alpha-glucosidase/alpha-galactosidase [Lachnospiraceae bacterium]